MSSNNNTRDFSDDLDSQNFEIKDELKVRKVLEKNTEWNFVFNKNTDYQYDLAITEWGDKPTEQSDKEIIGYVELERSRRDKKHSWVTGDIPDSWYYLSFLQRKVRGYDHRRNCWQGLKQDYDRTVYLKFNHALDNCFSAPIEAIHLDGKPTKMSDGSYNNSYLKLNTDHPDVRVGVENSVAFIQEYLTQRDTGQSSLTNFKE